jgi:hypothetical protein
VEGRGGGGGGVDNQYAMGMVRVTKVIIDDGPMWTADAEVWGVRYWGGESDDRERATPCSPNLRLWRDPRCGGIAVTYIL